MLLPTDFELIYGLLLESWDVVTCVIQLWFVPDMNAKQKHYAMEMVLMDERFIRVSLLFQCFILDFN